MKWRNYGIPSFTAKMASIAAEEMLSSSSNYNGRHWEGDREAFPCEHCGRVFERERGLARHVEKRHAKREGRLVSEHARLVRIVNPAYVARKRRAWTRHGNYREQRDLRIRCGKTTFDVHGVFMSQVRPLPNATLVFI